MRGVGGSGGKASAPSSVAGARSYMTVAQALPADRQAHQVHSGDLDGDGDQDALVVTRAGSDAAAPRGIIALLHGSDGWRVAARNDRAVPCASCGGAMGDPLAGVDIASGGFVLRFEGGSRELWSAAFHFRYEPAATRWVLADVHRKVLDRATGAAREAHAPAAHGSPLDFTEFDPADEGLAPLD